MIIGLVESLKNHMHTIVIEINLFHLELQQTYIKY